MVIWLQTKKQYMHQFFLTGVFSILLATACSQHINKQSDQDKDPLVAVIEIQIIFNKSVTPKQKPEIIQGLLKEWDVANNKGLRQYINDTLGFENGCGSIPVKGVPSEEEDQCDIIIECLKPNGRIVKESPTVTTKPSIKIPSALSIPKKYSGAIDALKATFHANFSIKSK